MRGEQAKPRRRRKVETETDVPAQTVCYARRATMPHPAGDYPEYVRAQRTEFGTYVAASQFYPALITGNIGKRGAGVCDAGGVNRWQNFADYSSCVPCGKIPDSIPKIGDWILQLMKTASY